MKQSLICQLCGKEFLDYPRKKNRMRKYCSRECGYEAKRGPIVSMECIFCGKPYTARLYELERGHSAFCSKSCTAKDHLRYSTLGTTHSKEHIEKCAKQIRGANHYNWNGGRRKSNGYVYLRQDGPKRYKQEHRIIAERILKRPLKHGEIVHHINGDKWDNRHCNLLICDNSFHHWLHRRMAAMYQREHFSHLENPMRHYTIVRVRF